MPGCLELSDFRSHALDKSSCGPKGKDDLYDRHFPLGQCFSWKSDEFLSLCCLPPWSTTSSDWSSSTISKFTYMAGAAHLGVLSPLLQVNESLDGNGNITDISLPSVLGSSDLMESCCRCWQDFLGILWATSFAGELSHLSIRCGLCFDEAKWHHNRSATRRCHVYNT